MTPLAAIRNLFGSPNRRDPLGPWGERVAARRLRRSGHRVLARNMVTPLGEADLLTLAPDRRTLVVVEVKSRRVSRDGADGPPPEAAITAAKRRKLIQIAQLAAKRRNWSGPVRIDVVAVERPDRGAPIVRVHESAVTL